MKIKFFSAGGTIDKIYFDKLSTYEVGEPKLESILNQANVHFSYELESLLQKDSLDITPAERALIRERISRDANRFIVMTHGTDTMIETAKALDGIPDKVIVLTGAMQPANFITSDAEFNIGFAVAAVQSLPDGVYIAMNGRIFHPERTRKNRNINSFEEI